MDGALASGRERQRLADIAELYDRATADYRHWSAGMHMHFGVWRWPLSPFDREAMVERSSADVVERLALGASAQASPLVLDLGCGVGATARHLAAREPRARVLGLSLSPGQVELGNRLSAELGLREQVELRVGDYRATPCPSGSVAGAYAIESSCYDPDDGARLIAEAGRVLAPGARLVVADAFRRRAWQPRAAAALERRMLAGWRLPPLNHLDGFVANLRAHGFDVDVEDVSWRVAPSLAQVPLVALGFRLREGWTVEDARAGNASAAVWGLLYALLFPRRFGYFVLTATRR